MNISDIFYFRTLFCSSKLNGKSITSYRKIKSVKVHFHTTSNRQSCQFAKLSVGQGKAIPL